MLFLPAAALCCLCSALVAMAAQLIQDDLTLTRRAGGNVSFSCRGTDQCGGFYVFWFQKKDTETFTRILGISRTNGQLDISYNHPQKDDFSAVHNPNGCELQIQTVQLSHSATYYCNCWLKEWYDIFGSGTKLFVDEQVVKPVVSVYPAASRAHLEGKSSLLCLASAMSPPLVQFIWKRQKKNGPLEVLTPAEFEQLELREPGRSASILLLHQQQNSTYKYRCYVKHEGGTVEAQTGNEGLVTVFSSDSASSGDTVRESRGTEPDLIPPAPPLPVPSQYQVLLLCVLYTVLIVKSLVYCCGLSLLMILRNKGPSTNCTHAY
ncbi:immunoglobulin lambda-1 light chain-like [Scomber scombrus]|uniref:immunoglobulin lambda-1 light chain-like n=1 Tax=Scomber scombrus TaxID=13677 RepID=UPI002DDA90B5|nr:immunoglobulin lambda-1 light chain-like [Scomber scombrus]